MIGMCVLLCTVVEVSYKYDRTIAIWTLQSISICLIRGYWLEYTTYLKLGSEKYKMGGISVYYFPSVCCVFKLLLTSNHMLQGMLG